MLSIPSETKRTDSTAPSVAAHRLRAPLLRILEAKTSPPVSSAANELSGYWSQIFAMEISMGLDFGEIVRNMRSVS